ncbi:integral membrane protein [Phlyctema vagabunda]|uniref:Integral membrane protein n=1 Tax=Phlyctema vagabunda TaxID=108571 RepID=A0ABR4PUZ3_9HELO
MRRLISRLLKGSSRSAHLRLTRWISTFIAAWFSLQLLQSKESDAYIDRVPPNTYSSTGVAPKTVRFAGRTMDLTLFALTRALDVIVGELWSRRKARRMATNKWSQVESIVSGSTDSAIFASSCALIMWSWIYAPSRLPRAYNKWITSAAQVDQRLLTALRRTRYGEIKYGLETGQAHVLQSMCKDYGWPLDYGDPVKSIPFPCELVHMGTGKNCEYHALLRWLRSFKWAFLTYLPLNMALTLRRPSRKAFLAALQSSIRSSSFLGTFIALYYYGICLARTRIGPKVLGKSTVACQQIDSGICIASGCAICGWSIMLENESRRKDIGLFVAPRALATLVPRRYPWDQQWRETMVFAMSTAVVFTCVAEQPKRVRGVLGKVLARVLNG